MNRRGLSPVVATILLIVVTVAVSITVAAWMGAITFLNTSQITGQKLKDEGFTLVWASTSGNTVQYYNLTDFISVAHSFNVTTIYVSGGSFSFIHGNWSYIYQ